MKKYLLSLLMFGGISLQAQNELQFDINISSPGQAVKFDALGFNAERIFYRIIDNNENLSDSIFNDIMRLGDEVYRWPGGATANFYHLNQRGYGLSRFEVEFIPDPMNCDFSSNTSDFCLIKDSLATRNYIYELLELADKYMERSGKPMKLFWIPNFLTFFINDSSQINKLNGVKTIGQLEALHTGGQISDGFRERLYENINAFNILKNHPSIDLLGIEYGNELYYHPVVANMSYNAVNSIPAWLFQSLINDYRAMLLPGVIKYKNLVEFYNNIFDIKNTDIKTGLPAAVISHLGRQANMNQVWNEAMRDSILPIVDGVAHHMYVKISGPMTDPSKIENAGNEDELAEIKSLIDQFLHTKLPNIDVAFDEFFGLTDKQKEMWVTEFNMDSGLFDGFLYRWMNTFLHGYFNFEYLLSTLDNPNEHNTVAYVFQHTFIASYGDIKYSAYAAEFDGTKFNTTKNTSFYTFQALCDLINRDVHKVNFTAQNSANLTRPDLLLRAYYEVPDASAATPDSGAVYLVFSNKSGQPANIDLANDVNITGISASAPRLPVEARYAWAGHLYSSNGKTEFSSTPTSDMFFVERKDIDNTSTYEIPGYAFGYLRIPYKRVNFVPSAINDKKQAQLKLYPNPASEKVVIELTDMLSKGTTVEVFNILGETFPVLVTQQSGKELVIRTSDLAPGTYFCRLKTNEGTATGSFVKQ